MSLILRHLDIEPFASTFAAQKALTDSRGPDTCDEIWLLQHAPVYTQGQAGRPEHLLHATDIPVVKVDRGGQITYHGPGQIIAYLLLDLRRSRIGVRDLVRRMEQAVIGLCAEYGIEACGRDDAPGVYVAGAKLASLGLRIRNGCCYHGLALNADMDLTPFLGINPCGYQGLPVTQLRALGVQDPVPTLALGLLDHLLAQIAPDAELQATHTRWSPSAGSS